MSDVNTFLLLVIIVLLGLQLCRQATYHQELVGLIDAFAEMIGEEIDNGKDDDISNSDH